MAGIGPHSDMENIKSLDDIKGSPECLGVGEEAHITLHSGQHKGQIHTEGHDGQQYIHFIVKLSTTMHVMAYRIDKQLINARVDGTEWQHITMVLPKFSSAYTLEIILAATENDTGSVTLLTEVFLATTAQLPIICQERSCDVSSRTHQLLA